MALWLTIVLGGILAWQFVNLFRLQRWLKHRAPRGPAGHRRRLGRRRRDHQPHLPAQAVPQAPRDAAVPRVPPPDRRAAGRRRAAVGGQEILWFNRMAAELLGLRRKVDVGIPIANLVRDPEFVAYLQKPGAGGGVVVRAQKWRLLARDVRHTRGPAVPDAGARRDPRDQARGDAQGFRRERIARAALAADGDLRLPRRARGGRRHRRRNGASRSRTCAARRSACARSSRTCSSSRASRRHGRGPDGAGGRAGTARAARARGRARRRPVRRTSSSTSTTASRLRGSETELHSIASNLISNAVKYTPVDGTITIRWATRGRRRATRRARHGHRHRARAPAAPDRALLPRGPRAGARQGRLRARAFDRQAWPAATRRPARDRERRGPRFDLHRALSITARDRAYGGCNKSVIVRRHNPAASTARGYCALHQQPEYGS